MWETRSGATTASAPTWCNAWSPTGSARTPTWLADLAVADGEPTRLLDLWREAERVVLVDAMRADAASGTVVVVDALAGPVPTHGRAASSHAAGLGDAVALGRALGRLPESLWIVGVVGDRFEIGADRSPPVAAAVGAAAAAVRALA